MSYETIYHSPWHNPGLFVLANVLLAGFLLLRKTSTSEQSFLKKFGIILAVLATVDACLTGELAPFPGAIVPYVAIPFVILGDVRYFFLLERYARPEGQTASTMRVFLRSVAWGFIVPVLANLVRTLFFPDKMGLWVFLTYELLFLLLALGINFFLLPVWLERSNISTSQKRWIWRLAWFELAFYVLWAMSDIVILSGHDEGYMLRLLPNIMYYAFFGWIVALTAPEEIRP